MGYFSEIDINGYDVVVVVKDYGEDGHSPYIGENGNWWIDGVDTGVSASAGTFIDGGSASSVYTEEEEIDGGGA